MLHITAIPAFSDNYIWLLQYNHLAVLVDPGNAKVALHALASRQLQLTAILVTHHHADHCGGVPELLQHSAVPVYGPKQENLPFITHSVQEGDTIDLLAIKIQVFDIPGHTRGHIAYYTPSLLFCGDTLFTGGCGKLFEGTPLQLYQSLQKLAALPEDALIYCGHEYTLANLRFAVAVEPQNLALIQRFEEVKIQREQGNCTVPATLSLELQTNPFLRVHVPEVQTAVENFWHKKFQTPIEIFAALREWKNEFKLT